MIAFGLGKECANCMQSGPHQLAHTGTPPKANWACHTILCKSKRSKLKSRYVRVVVWDVEMPSATRNHHSMSWAAARRPANRHSGLPLTLLSNGDVEGRPGLQRLFSSENRFGRKGRETLDFETGILGTAYHLTVLREVRDFFQAWY